MKRSAINDYFLDNGINVLCVTEKWLYNDGDEAKYHDLAPPDYNATSFPCVTSICRGIAFAVCE